MEGDREGTELGRIVIIFLSFYLNSLCFFFYSAVSVTGIQQSNSVIIFQILFSYRLL